MDLETKQKKGPPLLRGPSIPNEMEQQFRAMAIFEMVQSASWKLSWK